MNEGKTAVLELRKADGWLRWHILVRSLVAMTIILEPLWSPRRRCVTTSVQMYQAAP